MTWLRIDDGMVDHRKWAELESDPRTWAECLAVWVALASYCQRTLSDGHVPESRLARLTPLGARAKARCDDLVRVGLMERVEDGYLFHDWLEYQASREKVEERREAKTRRQDKWRKSDGRFADASTSPPVDARVDASTSAPRDAPVASAPSHPIPSHPRREGERASAPSLTNAADRVRKLIADGYRSRGLAVPSKVASLAATAETTAALAGIPFEALPEILEKFFSDPEIIERKWPVSWLLTNANQWGASAFASASTALPADLDDVERIAVERARSGRWPNPGSKLAAAHARVLARHPGICPPSPEVLS